MAASPYAGQVARNTTGYQSYMNAPIAKKKNTTSIYAAPIRPGSTANILPEVQPASALPAQSPAHAALAVDPLQQFDYHTDPILQQINAVGLSTRENADANTLAAKKQIALRYGDPSLANQLGDTATADAAASNPYGAYQDLAKQNKTDAHNLDENLNSQNLYFSGARIKQQGDLADQYGKANAGLAANEQDALGATDAARLSAYSAADAADSAAAQDAAARALQEALLNQPAPSFDLAGLLGGGTGAGTVSTASGATPAPAGGVNIAGFPANTSYQNLGVTPQAIGGNIAAPDTASYAKAQAHPSQWTLAQILAALSPKPLSGQLAKNSY